MGPIYKMCVLLPCVGFPGAILITQFDARFHLLPAMPPADIWLQNFSRCCRWKPYGKLRGSSHIAACCTTNVDFAATLLNNSGSRLFLIVRLCSQRGGKPFPVTNANKTDRAPTLRSPDNAGWLIHSPTSLLVPSETYARRVHSCLFQIETRSRSLMRLGCRFPSQANNIYLRKKMRDKKAAGCHSAASGFAHIAITALDVGLSPLFPGYFTS